MSIASIVAQNISYLRRYARALTGQQTAGDAYVTATLEALLNPAELMEGESDGKVALFKAFTRIWNSVAVNQEVEPVIGLRDVTDHRLSRLTPLPRQAFLLNSLEGFSDEFGARVLEVDRDEFRRLLDVAGQELASEIATDVLIIEDEPLIAMDIEAMVETLGHRVTAIARTHSEALSLAMRRPPGLILADIQLADGSSGLEAANDLIKSFSVPVVFITAYPERFLTGERPEPAFLVAKPFRASHVSAVISQALFFERNATRRRLSA